MRSNDSAELLFCKYNTFGLLENQKRLMTAHINQLPEPRLLDALEDTLTAELVERFQLTVPQLDESGITVSSPREVQMDVSGDFRFGYGVQSIKGMEVIFCVPYAGDAEFFRVRPTHFNLNPPRAILRTRDLGFPFRNRELNADQIRREFDGQLKSVKEFLTWQANDVKPFNDNLRNNAMQAIGQRRDKLSSARNAVSLLGFPIKG